LCSSSTPGLQTDDKRMKWQNVLANSKIMELKMEGGEKHDTKSDVNGSHEFVHFARVQSTCTRIKGRSPNKMLEALSKESSFSPLANT
jgi:hypothetical protein